MPPKEKTYPLSQIAKTAATKTEQCLQIFTKYSPTASHMKCSKKKKAEECPPMDVPIPIPIPSLLLGSYYFLP